MQYCFFCHCISTQLHHYPSWKKSSYLITWNVERPVKTAGRHIYSLPINRCNFWMNLNICENTILTIQLAQPLWLFGKFLLDFLAESWSWCAFLFTQRVEICRNQQSAVMHELFDVSKVTLSYKTCGLRFFISGCCKIQVFSLWVDMCWYFFRGQKIWNSRVTFPRWLASQAGFSLYMKVVSWKTWANDHVTPGFQVKAGFFWVNDVTAQSRLVGELPREKNNLGTWGQWNMMIHPWVHPDS